MKIAPYITVVIFISIPGLLLRFTNPELTETQLFLKYWYVWITEIIMICCVYWMMAKRESK